MTTETPAIMPTPKTEPTPKKLAESFENKVPSLWTILPTDEDGVITATSNASGEKFEGTIEEFNARLK